MNDITSWIAQLRKGIVEMLILLMLEDEALYGYRLVRQLKKVGQLVAGEGTVYPILRRLESNNYVTARWVHKGTGNPRKYYSITPGGKDFLTRALAQWDNITISINQIREVRYEERIK